MAKADLDEGEGARSAIRATGTDPLRIPKRKSKILEQNGGDENNVNNVKLSKEERRERKKLKRLRTAGEETSPNIAPGNALAKEDSYNSPFVVQQDPNSKAARKAEKKRLRKLEQRKVDELHNGNGISQTVLNSEGLSNGSKTKKPRLEAAEEFLTDCGNTLEKVASMSAAPSKSMAYKENSALSAIPQSEINTFLSSHNISVTDPTTDSPLRPIVSFSQLPSDAHPQPSPFSNFKAPTPIQAASWPFMLSGRDVIGVAETGSGKTLAFGIPCVRHVLPLVGKGKRGAARAVIVSPTRELAVQSFEQMQMLSKPAGLHAVCVYGGVPKEGQREDLKRAQIVVATPGRLMDLIEEGSACLEHVSYLVLDEADRMLDKGFEDAIRKIVLSTSKSGNIKDLSRQTLMFTATWPPSIRELAATFMNSPVKIVIGDSPDGELRANTRIEQRVEVVDPHFKETRLLQLLKQYQSGKSRNDRILVFCLYKKEATRVESNLRYKGFHVAGIHGDLSQEKRMASLEGFKKGTTPLLVATDVAARGLDIPAVKVVINVTFPLTSEDYVHRIGRTGRAGASGLAITLFTEHDKAQSGPLINVLRAAGQPVPEELMKFGTTVKRKGHDGYGAFYREVDEGMKTATKIKFDD